MSDMLSNYGYSYVATALQGNLIGAIVNKFGPQYAGASPIGNILSKAGAIYNRYGQGATIFPSTNAALGPNVYNGGREDASGDPIDPKDIIGNIKEDFKVLNKNLQDASLYASMSKDEIGQGVSNFVGSVGNGLNKINPFNKGISEETKISDREFLENNQ
jgi:hypothetical protein